MADEQTSLENLEFLPEDLNLALLDFQRNGVRFGINNEGRCLIGDEMGLGKTLQAISIAYCYKDEWPMLIVVPSSMKYPWIEEIEKWITDLEPGDINLIRSGTDISNIPTSKISILGYGLCGDRRSSKLLVNALKKQAFKVIILDESHYLKNRNTGRTKLLHPIAKAAKRIILLTGTPSLARPEELYIQLDIVRPGAFGSFSNFANRYCEAHYEDLGKFRKWNTRGACRLNELHSRLNKGIMIRRLKKNVLTQLPPKRRQKITFDLPESEHKKELFQAKTDFRKYHRILEDKESLPQKKSEAYFELHRLSGVLYHYTGIAKAGAVQHYISDLLDGMDNKFIVFCRHKQVITAVIQQLSKKHVKYIHIDGSVPSSVRGTLVNQFQNNPSIRVAVLAIEAASFGLTLTAADHVVFGELHYTPGVMMQAEDRAHRIGQVNAVNVHYLVGRGTLDEVLWGMLRRKIYVTSSALDGKLHELQADEGDEEKSKQLSACAAWLREESEEDDEVLQEYLFSQKPKKSSSNQIEGQRDVRTFLTPSSTTDNRTSEVLVLDSDEEMTEVSSCDKTDDKTECKDNTTISIDDSSEDESEEYGEEKLASMLIEEDGSSTGSDASSGKAAKVQGDSRPCLTNGKDLNERKKSGNEISHESVKNSSVQDLNARLYEHSEVQDSEEIFQSYISTDIVGDDNDDDEDDDDDEHVPMKALDKDHPQSQSLPSSSYLNEKSLPENPEVEKHYLSTSTKSDSLDNCRRSTLKSLDVVEDHELEKSKADSLERSRIRNPFSLKNKGMSNEKFSSKIIESDSEDDFVSSMPTSSHERENELDVDTSDQKKEIPFNDSTSTESSISSRQRLRKKKKSKARSRNLETKASWSCRACTFMNDPQMIECSICFTARHQEEPVLNGGEFILNSHTENTQDLRASQGTSVSDLESQEQCSLTVVQAEDTSSDYFSGVSTNAEDSKEAQIKDFVLSGNNKPSDDLFNVAKAPSKSELVEEKRNDTKIKPLPIHKDNPSTSLFDDKKDLDDFRESFSQWPCSACTFLNDAMLNECSMCMTPRRRSQRKARSRWSTWNCQKRRREKSEKSRKRRSNIEKAEEDNESKAGIRAGFKKEEEQIIITNFDDRLKEIRNEPRRLTESSKRTQTRKRLNTEDQDEGTSAEFEKSSTVDVKKAEKDDNIGDFEEKSEQNFSHVDVMEEQQECAVMVKEHSGQELEGKADEDPFILEFSDSDSDAADAKEDVHDKNSFSSKDTVHVKSREEYSLSNMVEQQTTATRREEIIDDGDDGDIADGKESSSCTSVLYRKPVEGSNSTIVEQPSARDKESIYKEDDKDNNGGKKGCSVSHEESNSTVVKQPSTRDKESIYKEDDKDNNGGKKGCSVSHEESNSTVVKQPSTRDKESIDDEGDKDINGAGKEGCSVSYTKPHEESKSTKIVENESTDKENDEDFNGEKEVCSVTRIGDESKSPNVVQQQPHKGKGVDTDDDRMSDQKITEGGKIVHEPVATRTDACDGLSNTMKPVDDESLEELQQAAEQIFADDDDMLEHLDATDSICIGEPVDKEYEAVDPNKTKCRELIVRKPRDPPEPVTLRFAMSSYTERVYLYDEEEYLKCNFLRSDLKDNNKEELPHILQHEYNFKQAKRMLKEWDRLGIQQKRTLAKSKLIFKDPLEGYHRARAVRNEGLTNVRHPNKELRLQKVINAALEVGGQVRLVTRSPATRKRKRTAAENDGPPSNLRKTAEGTTTSSKEFFCAQAFGPDGVPLCLFCKVPVDYGTLGNEWDSRFCSHDCKENYQIRISGTGIRRNLFEAEQGVCQLCHFDAHACFRAVKSLPKKDRRAFLEESVYYGLPSQLLNRMIVDPKEGMFWEADHIVAVAEGGGECGMENFRTLCVPCHKQVTRELLQRLRTKRQRIDVTGSKSISTLLASKS